jgi:hypothetical protein
MSFLKLAKLKKSLEYFYKDYPYIIVKHSYITDALEIEDYRNNKAIYIPFCIEGIFIHYEGIKKDYFSKEAYLIRLIN